MDDKLIVVRQLPVIEDQLREIKANVEARVGEALSMACTEETRQAVKEARSALNKEFGELEARRKEVKAAILAPYEAFEALYKECAGDIYKDADRKLKARIDEVEDGLRQQKTDEVSAYFEEYRQSLGIDADFVGFNDSGIKVTLSDSKKALRTKAKEFLDRVADDLALIETQEQKEEILVEYRRTLNVATAVTTVNERHKAMEAERRRREAVAATQIAREDARAKVEAAVKETATAPAVMPPAAVLMEDNTPPTEQVADKLYSAAFRVTGSLDQLRTVKKFLVDGGFTYEQL